MERYIEYFNGYRNAYGVADFNHQDSKIDSETGKKKPVYRWNFEELTDEIYQQHLMQLLVTVILAQMIWLLFSLQAKQNMQKYKI